jgi:hypothetical protein
MFPITLEGFTKGSWAGTVPVIGVSWTPPEAALAMVTVTLRLDPVAMEACVTPSESATEKPELLAEMMLLSGAPGDTRETALIRHLLASFGSTVIDSILSLVRSKSLWVIVAQFRGSPADSTNCRLRSPELLPLVEVIVSNGAMLSWRVTVWVLEVFPFWSLAKPPAAVTISLSDTMPVLVTLKVTPVPLNTGVVAVQPVEALRPAMSFKVTDSLKVRDTFTLLVMLASLVSELAVIEGFDVLTTKDKAGDTREV